MWDVVTRTARSGVKDRLFELLESDVEIKVGVIYYTLYALYSGKSRIVYVTLVSHN